MNKSIFKYLNPNGNDSLSEYKKSDLLTLLVLLNDYDMHYRDILNFKNSVTFGTEIEFDKAKKIDIQEKLYDSFRSWVFEKEDTVPEGGEVDSPILNDSIICWKDLKDVCSIIRKNASISELCGSHVHIGTQILGKRKETWLNFIKIWSVYENIIYRFMYGEYTTARTNINYFAVPMSERFMKIYKTFSKNDLDIYMLIDELCYSRCQVVNFNNVDTYNLGDFGVKNTIEFRGANGTLNPIIWQNYINLYVSLIEYSTRTDFEHDILDKRYKKNKDYMNNLKFYDEIFIDQAIELSDLIYKTNIDKIYFLKQYFKSFNISDEFNKCLTKK